MSNKVDEILRGSFDLHLHTLPSPNDDLRMDALDTGRHAQEAEMAGFVLKSHFYPTTPVAQLVSRVYPGLRVAGSIVLNNEVGGLNSAAVQAAADIGARVVWMPARSAATSEKPGLRLTSEAGTLLPEVTAALEIVRDADMVLASGHASPDDTLALLAAARDIGVARTMVTHPVGTANDAQIREMAALGAYIEHTFLPCMPSRQMTTPSQMAASIHEIGVDRCIVTTDFGQWMNPSPAEGMRMAIAELLNAGMSDDEVTTLVKNNPLGLIGP
ncbi:MAG: DUF6282 family protein [SAR202 cluster bacterium]|nr:DUF6282 family protein [SAR202 cluster bacterium]